MRAVLISCYDLGHQPFGLAEPTAWLRQSGIRVDQLDLVVETIREEPVRAADLIAFHVPMHTATRLAVGILPRIREINPKAHICFYGLYAPLNVSFLKDLGVGTVLGGEFETGLLSLAERLQSGEDSVGEDQKEPLISRRRQDFLVPDRLGLPSLDQYARLRMGNGESRTSGYVEASRGCKHLCRHCPIVPVYQGRFRIVPADVVLEDVRMQAAAGARHITFGDPDFLNAPGHSIPLVKRLHQEFPELTYDVTAKVEHLLRHADILPELRRTGCLFVTTAVESIDDRVLGLLDKGHTMEDFRRVVGICTEAQLALSPTFIPFTPWIDRLGYLNLLETLASLDLIDQVAPVQLTIRLLIPPGSSLLELQEVRRWIGPLDAEKLCYPWVHQDDGMDRLHQEVEGIVRKGEKEGRNRREVFFKIWETAHRRAGLAPGKLPDRLPRSDRVTLPYMTEPWYC